jgi:copper chaperone CopZ
VLTPFKGVEKVDIDLAKQLVVVEGTATQDDVLKAIQKTGKKVSPIA